MSIDQGLFKQAMAEFPSGVTIVTTAQDGVDYGMTVSAFSSVSLEPALVLVCIANGAAALAPIIASGAFAVHILRADQEELAWSFAGKASMVERFRGLEFVRRATGSPVIAGCISALDCRIHSTMVAGDHTIVVGEVAFAEVNPSAPAAVYHRRAFHRIG